MRKISEELSKILYDTVVSDIGVGMIHGVTYCMALDGDAKGETKASYVNIMRRVIEECGTEAAKNVCQMYSTTNGVVLVIDDNVMEKISSSVYREVDQKYKVSTMEDFLSSVRDRRAADRIAMAKWVASEFAERPGQRITVALYNRNVTPRIVITGRTLDGRAAAIKYHAYALRVNDIAEINRDLLMPRGIRISKIATGEILPTKTGVHFDLVVEAV